MARVALEIPKIGLVMENARLVRWLKSVGDTVAQGEALLELETEKSVVEIEATVSGTLVEQVLDVDQEAQVGDLACWIETEAAPGAEVEERIRSTPVARRLAAQHEVDLGTLAGSGPGGRIQLADVQRAIETKPAPGASRGHGPLLQSRQTAVGAGHARDSSESMPPLPAMRRALARAMTLSNATVPQFAVERAVDWTAIQAARARLAAEQRAPRLSVNDFLLHAIARALLAHPALNATFRGDPDSPDATIVPASGASIGLVVAVENGLLVPVLHGVEKLGLAEIARRRADVVDRALHGRLKTAELDGATFSLSNLGAHGPDRFNAIISPPQSAILAVGRQRDCVVALNGKPEIRPISDLSLTVDHRVADGRLAAEFLATLVELLESNAWSVT